MTERKIREIQEINRKAGRPDDWMPVTLSPQWIDDCFEDRHEGSVFGTICLLIWVFAGILTCGLAIWFVGLPIIILWKLIWSLIPGIDRSGFRISRLNPQDELDRTPCATLNKR